MHNELHDFGTSTIPVIEDFPTIDDSPRSSDCCSGSIRAQVTSSPDSKKGLIDVLLVYPILGNWDNIVMDLPLSIIYAAAGAIKRGFRVKAIDLRCCEGDWKDALRPYLDEGVRMVGISVMTGSPLKNAREVALFVKRHSPETKVLWGGPHCTVVPETINEPFLDFLIRGYGSAPLADLVEMVRSGKDDPSLFSNVKGLSYKVNGEAVHVPRPDDFEQLHFKEIPYHLVDVNLPRYVRSYNGHRMFSIFTSIGCPYKCTFCVSPATFKEINGRHWLPSEDKEVVDHIEYINKTFDVQHVCFIDDTSFPQLDRMRRIFEEILARNIKVTLEFRGARVNEINKMDDDFIDLMVRAGGRFLMSGVESGSDRILKSIKNGQNREMIENVNRKLARHSEITVHYNFIYGTPHERLQDLEETKMLQLQLVRDNPSARIGFGGDWKPIPGTKLLEEAERDYGFVAPKTLDDWIQMDSADSDDKLYHSWYTPEHNRLIKLLQMGSFVIDDKMIKETSSNRTLGAKLLRFLARTYKPIALFRMKNRFYGFLIEYDIWRIFSQKIVPLLNLNSKASSTKNVRGV
jgi:radical SAM superfamily enzyme YgiQ (UPF0313 family)